jgi:hypothetical protein
MTRVLIYEVLFTRKKKNHRASIGMIKQNIVCGNTKVQG